MLAMRGMPDLMIQNMQNFSHAKNHAEFLRITHMLNQKQVQDLVLVFINKIEGQIHFRDHSTGKKCKIGDLNGIT